MVRYKEEMLTGAIVREYKCSEKDAIQLMKYATCLSDELQPVLDAWIENGTILDFNVNDVNIQYIMNKMQTSFLPALFHMNKFIEIPHETVRFKKLRIMNKDVAFNGDKKL